MGKFVIRKTATGIKFDLKAGNGEVIVPDQQFVAIGSGGNYAYAAANALYNNTDLSAEDIVRKSLEIASSICVYTNSNISIEKCLFSLLI